MGLFDYTDECIKNYCRNKSISTRPAALWEGVSHLALGFAAFLAAAAAFLLVLWFGLNVPFQWFNWYFFIFGVAGLFLVAGGFLVCYLVHVVKLRLKAMEEGP